jgi:hypothetical protein
METVELMKDHSGFAMGRDCHVYRDKKDTITWTNDTDTPFTIHFAQCPLKENDFTIPAKGRKGPIELDPNALPATDVYPKTYAYEIRQTVAGSVMAADPNVIVH